MVLHLAAFSNVPAFGMDSKLAHRKQSVMHKYGQLVGPQQHGNKGQQTFPYLNKNSSNLGVFLVKLRKSYCSQGRAVFRLQRLAARDHSEYQT